MVPSAPAPPLSAVRALAAPATGRRGADDLSRSDGQRRALKAPSSRSLAELAIVIAAPCARDVPLAGAVIDTVGRAFTMRVIAALVRLPPASVTEAVMVCVPERSVDTASGEPVPRVPSRFELQRIGEARLPCSASRAVPVKVTVAPGTTLAPFAGPVMVSDGPPFTVRVICALPRLPPVSVAAAVMTWMPERRKLTLIDGPVPSAPSRFDDQL